MKLLTLGVAALLSVMLGHKAESQDTVGRGAPAVVIHSDTAAWQVVSAPERLVQIAFDRTHVLDRGAKLRMVWVRLRFDERLKRDDHVREVVSHFIYDCAARRQLLIDNVARNAQGQTVSSYKRPFTDVTPGDNVVPDSVGEAALTGVCNATASW